MSIVSLTKRTFLGKNQNPKEKSKKQLAKVKKEIRHPVRVRILNLLKHGERKTQCELGRDLSMSNAAVHYHLKALVKIGLVRLFGTRPGPKGITEKLYELDAEAWQQAFDLPSREGDLDFYVDYALSWIDERHREGVEILKKAKGEPLPPFALGSFTVHAPVEETVRFKHELEQLCDRFFQQYGRPNEERATFAVTFTVLPSGAEDVAESQNVLHYESE